MTDESDSDLMPANSLWIYNLVESISTIADSTGVNINVKSRLSMGTAENLFNILDAVIGANPNAHVVVSRFVASHILKCTGYNIASSDTASASNGTYPMGSYGQLVINVDPSMTDKDRRILIYDGDGSLVKQSLIPIGIFNSLN